MEELIRVENNKIIVAKEYMNKYAEYLKTKAKWEIQEKKFKEALQSAMAENGIKSYENEVMTVTYVAETTSKRIDTARLKKEIPEIIEAYEKESKVSAHIKVSIK